ncbi:phage holin family protein [Nocardioides sp. zg-1308]|uniref:phage holin family protein n=1 Tax=Nocardioides TaxID=1839 RepID=UPI0015533C7A|nr:phage holin family protein [Nocardioides sp. S-34]NPD06255.1 phage holin family protein [Nocardioides sp. zg-1308]WQQ24276.1 phage holin family protein [Nocardioides sp. S-34]
MTVVAFILRWVLLALAVVLAAWVTPDVDFRGGPLSALVVAALIAAANVVAQLALRWLPSPDNVLALAALTLVVNGCVVWLASVLTTRLRIDGFVAAVTFALMVTVFSVALGWAIQRVLDRFDRSTVGETA